MRKLLHIAAMLLIWFASAGSRASEEGVYISDMSKCAPSSILSNRLEKGKWTLIPFETDQVSGTMVKACSYIKAPNLTVPLHLKGWHALYIGYWNPDFDYDGDFLLRVKLSRDPAFCRISESKSVDTQKATYLRETFFRYDDLTGQSMVIGKSNGILGKKASVAYIKAVPLSEEAVKQIEADRARKDTKRLIGSIDGMSFFHSGEFTQEEHVLEVVEPFRYSDVGRIMWAVNYGDKTNYPSNLDEASFIDQWGIGSLVNGESTNDYCKGSKQMHDTLLSFKKKGVISQRLAAKSLHEMGIKLDVMFRPSITGRLSQIGDKGIIIQHPQFRQVDRNGTVIDKASYAFPQVRQFALDMIKESVNLIDADGVNLCFVRGPHFLQYEQPVLDAFKAKYDEDARKHEPSDPRLCEIKASIMTEFVKKVRAIVDETSKKRGKKMELSCWAWVTTQGHWLGGSPMNEGLDLESWVKEGLLDSIVCECSKDTARFGESAKVGYDPHLLELCKKSNCKYIAMSVWSREEVVKLYEKGVEYFAIWDFDSTPLSTESWAWWRRVGHREEMQNWKPEAFMIRSIRLKTVDGIDVLTDLQQSVYSGG